MMALLICEKEADADAYENKADVNNDLPSATYYMPYELMFSNFILRAGVKNKNLRRVKTSDMEGSESFAGICEAYGRPCNAF